MLVHFQFRQTVCRPSPCAPVLLAAFFFLASAPVMAQTDSAATAPADASAALQRRIERARTLAVVGQGVTAARELEAIRVATANDPANPAHGVAGVLLMGLYVEQADYRRAQQLLEEVAARRSAAANSNDDAARTYYAIAGQLLNGLRGKLERYRLFNVPVTGVDVPAEAAADLEGMRTLLDALMQHGRAGQGGAGSAALNSTDAAALFEDAVGLRLNLARTTAERTTLQRELADARQRLAAVEPRLQPNRTRAAGSTAPRSAASSPPTNSAPIANPAPVANPTPATNSAQSVSSGSPANPSSADNTPRQSIPQSTNPTNSTSGEEAGRNGAGRNERGALLEVGSLTERATQRVPPSYPLSARSARVSGIVTVYLVVNEQGSVEEVRRAAGPQLLRRAAEDAARRWRFRPVTVGGQAVRAMGYISFNFTL